MERFAAILRAAAPDGRGDPSIVVLGDGFENDAQWEISESPSASACRWSRSTTCAQRDGRVYARVDGRRRPVDVIYRRSNYHLLREEDGSPERAGREAARADAARHGDGRQPARASGSPTTSSPTSTSRT